MAPIVMNIRAPLNLLATSEIHEIHIFVPESISSAWSEKLGSANCSVLLVRDSRLHSARSDIRRWILSASRSLILANAPFVGRQAAITLPTRVLREWRRVESCWWLVMLVACKD
jgi:hypothetical protein